MTKHRRYVSVAALSVAALSGLFLSNEFGSAQGGYEPDLVRGQAVYTQACAACHGARLEGEANWRMRGPDGRLPAPPHDASGHTWHHSDRVLLDIVTRGTAAVAGGVYESNMPGFGEVYSGEELIDVLEWIKTQWPKRERHHQARMTAQDTSPG